MHHCIDRAMKCELLGAGSKSSDEGSVSNRPATSTSGSERRLPVALAAWSVLCPLLLGFSAMLLGPPLKTNSPWITTDRAALLPAH